MDKGYDSRAIHDGCEDRGCRPIIAEIRARNAVTQDDVPTCEHGRWTFAEADFKRKRTKWRRPNAGVSDDGQLPLACSPASVWIKADRRNPLVPRQTKRWGDLYRGRSAVEREFGRLLLTETTFPPVGDGKSYPVGAIFRKSTEVAPFRVRKLAAGLISAA